MKLSKSLWIIILVFGLVVFALLFYVGMSGLDKSGHLPVSLPPATNNVPGN